MADVYLIEKAKMAKRITTDKFDDEVDRLLDAAYLDLGVAGVVLPDSVDALVEQAAITYFMMNFGEPANSTAQEVLRRAEGAVKHLQRVHNGQKRRNPVNSYDFAKG